MFVLRTSANNTSVHESSVSLNYYFFTMFIFEIKFYTWNVPRYKYDRDRWQWYLVKLKVSQKL